MQIRIVDHNQKLIDAIKAEFADCPEVEISCGDLLKSRADAWVVPTNKQCNMSGGLEAQVAAKIAGLQHRVKAGLEEQFNGQLPIGRALITETGKELPRYLVSTAVMEGDSDNIRRTKNTALAIGAAFQAIYQIEAGDCQSIVIPGLGTGTGRVKPKKGARLMKAGYNLFRRGRFDSFKEMIVNLNEVLGELDLPDVAAEPVEFDGSLAEGIDAVIGGAGKIEGAPKVIGIGMEAITPETIGNLNDDIEVKEKLDIKMVPNNAELEDELRGMSDDMLSRLAKTNTLHLWADNKTPDKEAMVQALLIHLSQVA